jgi:hypothetical protein
MPTNSCPSPDRPSHVIVRFSLKLAMFIIACGFQVAVGASNPFFEITALAAVLCVIIAVSAREKPFDRSLTYWDEAVVFGLLSQLG